MFGRLVSLHPGAFSTASIFEGTPQSALPCLLQQPTHTTACLLTCCRNSIWAFWIHEVGSEALNPAILVFPLLFLRVMKSTEILWETWSCRKFAPAGKLILFTDGFQIRIQTQFTNSIHLIFYLTGDLCVEMPQTPSHTLCPVPSLMGTLVPSPALYGPISWQSQASCSSLPSWPMLTWMVAHFLPFLKNTACMDCSWPGASEGTGSSGGMRGENLAKWCNTAQNSGPAS